MNKLVLVVLLVSAVGCSKEEAVTGPVHEAEEIAKRVDAGGSVYDTLPIEVRTFFVKGTVAGKTEPYGWWRIAESGVTTVVVVPPEKATVSIGETVTVKCSGRRADTKYAPVTYKVASMTVKLYDCKVVGG